MDEPRRGLPTIQWTSGEKKRTAYAGIAAHATLPGVGGFILIAEDLERLGYLWDIVMGEVIPLKAEMTRDSAVMGEAVARQLIALQDRRAVDA